MEQRYLPGILLIATICGGFVSGAAGSMYVIYQMPRPVPIVRQVQVPKETNDPVADLVAHVMPSVVSVNILSKDTSQDPFGDQQVDEQGRILIGSGSGFFVSADGLIVTNRHVVQGKNVEYEVVTSDGRAYPAKVLTVDSVLDLAILKIDATDAPSLDFADSDLVRPGESVLAIGNALAEFQNSVTMGIVSGINRHLWAGDDEASAEVIEEAIQTDAAINPGNSGGPLIDLNGKVIGVNTAVSDSAQSLGFALPSNSVRRAVDSVRQFGRIVRPWIGIRYDMVEGGAQISKGTDKAPGVLAKSPAEKAGLKDGDLITTFDGQSLNVEVPLSGRLGKLNPGESVPLTVVRDGKTLNLTLVLGDQKDAP